MCLIEFFKKLFHRENVVESANVVIDKHGRARDMNTGRFVKKT